MKKKLKLAILGNGRLANIIVDAYKDGLLDAYEITGICGRTQEKTKALATKAGCRACSSVAELLEDKPDFVAEAASVQAMKDHAVEILGSGTQLVVLSIGSFADADFYEHVKQAALENDTKVHLVSGAIGGFDILRTVTLMGGNEAKCSVYMEKPPKMFNGTILYDETLESEDREVFSGSAAEAIKLLPTQVNVAVSASLATTGPEHTDVRIKSVRRDNEEQFNIYAESDKARVHIKIDSEPHTSSGWSVVARLQNLASPIVF